MNKALDSIEYKGGYKYQLVKEARFHTNIKPRNSIQTDFIYLRSDGHLVVKKGYAWDGATGTRDINAIMRGSVAHDAIFQLARMGLLDQKWFDEANRMFLDICKQDGMSWGRRWLVERGINTPFCRAAFSVKNKKVVYRVP